MANNLHNAENDLILSLYDEVLQRYGYIDELDPQPQVSVALKLQLINDCSTKINHLINLVVINMQGDNFDATMYDTLKVIQHDLMQLKHRTALIQPVVEISNAESQVKEPNSDEQKLQDAIEAMQVIPKVKGLQNIGGLDYVKRILTTIVILPIYQPQLFENRKISNSILLFGPPGTGKTRLAHAVAAEASACFFSVSASDILSRYVGQTEKLVRALFENLKREHGSNTILFMDEIDGLCRRRNNTENEWNRRLKTELMHQLSAIEDLPHVFFICATNCPWDLDPAFLRRFQRRIYVPLPTRPDRFELLQMFTKDTPLEDTSNYWGDVLAKTENYSGSDLADMVREALDRPITELITNTRWQVVDSMYQPVTHNTSAKNVVSCELQHLPPRSVKAREAQVSDLMEAVNVVKRTVTDATLRQYDDYINEHID